MIVLRILAWLVLFPVCVVALDPVLGHLQAASPVLDGTNYAVGTLWLASVAVIAWIIAGLPFRRRRAPTVPDISAAFAAFRQPHLTGPAKTKALVG